MTDENGQLTTEAEADVSRILAKHGAASRRHLQRNNFSDFRTWDTNRSLSHLHGLNGPQR